MNDWIEVLAVYLGFIIDYPQLIIVYASAEPHLYSLWLITGITAFIYLARQKKAQVLIKPLIAIWFMPGTFICGAATLLPWPITFWCYVHQFKHHHYCVKFMDLIITIGLNFIIVYVFVWVFGFIYDRIKRPNNTASG